MKPIYDDVFASCVLDGDMRDAFNENLCTKYLGQSVSTQHLLHLSFVFLLTTDGLGIVFNLATCLSPNHLANGIMLRVLGLPLPKHLFQFWNCVGFKHGLNVRCPIPLLKQVRA